MNGQYDWLDTWSVVQLSLFDDTRQHLTVDLNAGARLYIFSTYSRTRSTEHRMHSVYTNITGTMCRHWADTLCGRQPGATQPQS